MDNQFDIIIIGGGIVGLATAHKLTKRQPGLKVLVLEKEKEVAAHQTARNSGVIHSGIYYKPGSLKAELCTRGRSMLRELCANRDLPYVECGKLVVATNDNEDGYLDGLKARAEAIFAGQVIEGVSDYFELGDVMVMPGLGGLVEEMEIAATLDYEAIPHFPKSTATSHRGRLVLLRDREDHLLAHLALSSYQRRIGASLGVFGMYYVGLIAGETLAK